MDRTLVITALQLELEQLLNNFNFHLHVEHEIKDSRHYYIVSPNSQTTIVCTSILGMGQVNAALALKDALDYMSFDRIILAGICGGLSKELNMGDIIVSEKIVDYELAKELDHDSIHRWNVYNSDYSIINSMKNFSSDRWLHQLDEDYPSGCSPKVFFGTVLSGNKVMASRKKSQNLASVWDKALAIEMEASGIASTLYQTPNSPPFIMVKSVCDLADKEKNDNWQLVAAKTAAVYVIDFVFSLSKSSNLSMEDKSFSQEKNILNILKNNYNLPELKELCFNIDIDFDDLPGQGKSEKAVELIKYCQRWGKMSDLVARINLERNNILS